MEQSGGKWYFFKNFRKNTAKINEACKKAVGIHYFYWGLLKLSLITVNYLL
jgi:hypothetical protein